MRQRVVWINLALLAALGLLGYLLRQRWLDADRREREILSPNSTSATGKLPETKPSSEIPARASSYFEVAEKMLFSKDRNPTVVVETPQVKPMPPLPAAYGVMDLGSGPIAFLAEKDAAQRGYKQGETVGEFKLVAIEAQEITFEWDGKPIRRKLEELRPVTREGENAPQQTASAPAQQAAPSAPAPAASSSTTTSGDPWGNDAGEGMKLCRQDDTTTPGTVVKGFRKVVRFTPIAKTCYWEEVK